MYIILPSNRNERFTEALWETWYARVHFYVIKFWTVPHGSPKSIQIWWLIIISPLELPFGYPSFPDKVTTAGPNDWGAAAVGWGRDKARPLGDFPVSFHLKMDVSNGILNGISWDFELPSFFDGAYHHGLKKQAWHVRAARWVVPWRSKGLVECGNFLVDPYVMM